MVVLTLAQWLYFNLMLLQAKTHTYQLAFLAVPGLLMGQPVRILLLQAPAESLPLKVALTKCLSF